MLKSKFIVIDFMRFLFIVENVKIEYVFATNNIKTIRSSFGIHSKFFERFYL